MENLSAILIAVAQQRAFEHQKIFAPIQRVNSKISCNDSCVATFIPGRAEHTPVRAPKCSAEIHRALRTGEEFC